MQEQSISQTYCGRFAPSPTGPLHLGSLACALATWLDARAHDGKWIVRIEDIDPPRDVPGADKLILETLARFHLFSDIPVVFQSKRHGLYEEAFQKLYDTGQIYGCCCTRAEIRAADASLGLAEGVYPGTCRNGTGGREVRAWRFLVSKTPVGFTDRANGRFEQDLETAVGDFTIRRADGLWAYQLAVVVDDADQGITDIVRGADLLDNTPRQIALQKALGLPQLSYLHIPLVLDSHGRKLSKQNHAPAVPSDAPLHTLEIVWKHLGFKPLGADSIDAFLSVAQHVWAERWCM